MMTAALTTTSTASALCVRGLLGGGGAADTAVERPPPALLELFPFPEAGGCGPLRLVGNTGAAATEESGVDIALGITLNASNVHRTPVTEHSARGLQLPNIFLVPPPPPPAARRGDGRRSSS
ncbi:hypothetical protein FKM82_030717 [Ascaphus truei]